MASAWRALVESGSLVEGSFRPGVVDREFADPEVMRSLRRRSLARLRREVEPVPVEALARFLPAWHGIGSRAGGAARLLEVVTQLEGYPIPASILERDVLSAARVAGYAPRLLDELGAAGEVVWIGRGPIGRDDGRVALFRRERAELLASAGAFEPGDRPGGPLHDAIRQQLERRGATFFGPLRDQRAGRPYRRRAARRAVGPRLVGRGHQRHAGAVARALAAALPIAHDAPGPSERAPVRRAPPAAGRWSPTWSGRAARRPSAATPRRSPCWSGTAW